MKPARIHVVYGKLEGHVYVQNNQVVGVTPAFEKWLWSRWSTFAALVMKHGGKVEMAR